jgi:hypothetical protein
VFGAQATGSAYITDPVGKLIQVKDIELDFPGYSSSRSDGAKVTFITVKAPMTDDELDEFCHQVPGETSPSNARSTNERPT